MKAWIPELTIFRGLCIIAVILIHIFSNYTKVESFSIGAFIAFLLDLSFSFAVPAFVFLSGLLLIRNKTSLLSFFIKRLRVILIPYILFTIIFLLFDSKFSLDIFFKSLATGTGYYHLWFILLILQLYVLFPLISFLYNQKTFLIITIGLIHIIFLLCSEFYPETLSVIQTYFPFIGYLIYFFIGIIIGDNYEYFIKKILSLKLIFVLLLLVFFLMFYSTLTSLVISGILTNLVSLLYNLTAIIFLFKISYYNNIFTPLLKDLGILSFGIYLIHPIFLDIFSIDGTGDLLYIILIISVIFSSYASAKLIYSIPQLRILIGAK